MSNYVQDLTQFSEQALLVAALQSLGLTVNVSDKPQKVSMWTAAKAEIVIPRQNGAYEPAGYRKTESGLFSAVISEEDRDGVYNAAWQAKVKQSYAEKGLMRQAQRAGLRLIGSPVTGTDGVRRIQYQKV